MNSIALWYKFAMKQFAAESYLDRQSRWTNSEDLIERIKGARLELFLLALLDASSSAYSS